MSNRIKMLECKVENLLKELARFEARFRDYRYRVNDRERLLEPRKFLPVTDERAKSWRKWLNDGDCEQTLETDFIRQLLADRERAK